MQTSAPIPAARPPVLVLAGPTGTGKSDIALELAELLPLEIVTADSAQVYRGMDIGTAKPTAAQQAAVTHHLLDIRDPAETYSAGDFVRDAGAAIEAIHARGRVPLLVGGTMLYHRALYRGMAALPHAEPELRAQLERRAAAIGWPALHAELTLVDPVAAARIRPRDGQRIQRALEVFHASGRPISEWQRATPAADVRFHWQRFALLPEDRTALRSRLAARFEAMMAAGLLEEVRTLYGRRDLTAEHASMRAVGYRQLWSHLAGEITLEQARLQAVTATAQLAKRQLTWLRAESDWIALPVGSAEAVRRLRAAI
jgi:tRNA dimethylallyltransferase